MAGVKGRSGRKSMRDEEKRLRIIDKAWQLVAEKLNSLDTDRFQVARDIVIRDITQHIKGEGIASDTKVIVINPPKGESEAGNTSKRISISLPKERA